MKLIEINWQPTDRQLRQFGVICFFALPGIGWIWGGGATAIAVLAVIGLLLAMTGMVFPSVLKPVFLALTIVATPIGMVIGELERVSPSRGPSQSCARANCLHIAAGSRRHVPRVRECANVLGSPRLLVRPGRVLDTRS